MRKRILFIFLFLVCFVGLRSNAYAEKINLFDVEVVAHKSGEMSVAENINYDFEYGDRHGIYRDIPLFSKVGELYRVIKIRNASVERDGKKENFEIIRSKEQISFKIGNANKTITGPHVYRISYIVENGIGSNFPDHDEIYWNATGNGWQVPIERASIKFDSDFGAKITELKCFSGILESKESNCSSSRNIVSSNKILSSGQGLTAVAIYPKGTFPASILMKELPKTNTKLIGDFIYKHMTFIYLFLNIFLPLILIIWYQKHKNKKRFGPPGVNFDIPKDEKGNRIIPALAGTIDNAKLDREDVVATLFDLAIRKYIRLEEIKTKKNLRPDSKDQKITKLKDGVGLSTFEHTLFNRLFKDGADYVLTKDLKKDFYKTYELMENEIFRALVLKKYFVRNPKFQRGALFAVGLLAIFTVSIILGITLIYLSRKLIGRTSLGDEIDFKIDGLKLFLKSMDRNYKWQTDKFYTVEQMIPYAIALGYIDKFMEQLKIINPDYNPTWYHGYSGNFYLSYGAFYSSMNSNINTSAPSSSSGSSGGFSGGGGGGGGGGSW